MSNWAKLTPPGFIFHVKAYGLITNRNAVYGSMPFEAKALVSAPPGNEPVTWQGISSAARDAVWQRFNSALQPLHVAKKLGAIVFQFQVGFQPSADTIAHLRDCRARLVKEYRMAIEFRDRSWVAPEHRANTMALLRELGAPLILVDELRAELFRLDSDSRETMPLELDVVHDQWLYIRLFRRVGTDRLLSETEVNAWAQRLAMLRQQVKGPIFFMMATDHEDQPIKNMNAIAAAVPQDFVSDWRKRISKRGLGAFFGRPAADKAPAKDDVPAAPKEEAAKEQTADQAEVRAEPGRQAEGKRPLEAPAAQAASPKKQKPSQPTQGGPSIASFFSRKQ